MKTILITGGARGIGKAIVYELAKSNYNIILNYNSSQKEAEQIEEELTKQGHKVDIYKADITKKEEVQKMIFFTLAKQYYLQCYTNKMD